MTTPVLQVEKVTVDFDGYKALDRLDFELYKGELRSVIGPNGAGKTTLLDVISGKVRPSHGKVRFLKGKDISRTQEYQIAKLGIGRKFQTPSIFPSLTIYENLELALGYRDRLCSLLTPLSKARREQINNTLGLVNLYDKSALRAGALAHGAKQWLEIAMLLIQKPLVLLLDEPVAGMTKKERKQTGKLLQEISKDLSIVVVEHDMEFVREFATKVTVLHEGRTLCEGTTAEVQQNSQVIQAYLGRGAQKCTVA
jgi:urea transport system ATP-binding protein